MFTESRSRDPATSTRWNVKVQPILDAKCAAATTRAPRRTTSMTRPTRSPGMHDDVQHPDLDLSSTPVTVYYDKSVATYPASYVSIFYPATLAMGDDGHRSVTGKRRRRCGASRRARAPRPSSRRSTCVAADGTTAWPIATHPLHPEDDGVTLTDDERKTLIRDPTTSAASTTRARTRASCPSPAVTQSPPRLSEIEESSHEYEEDSRHAISVVDRAARYADSPSARSWRPPRSRRRLTRRATRHSREESAAVYGRARVPSGQLHGVPLHAGLDHQRGVVAARRRRSGRRSSTASRWSASNCIGAVAPAPLRLEREEPRDRRLVAPPAHPRRLRPRRGLRADA